MAAAGASNHDLTVLVGIDDSASANCALAKVFEVFANASPKPQLLLLHVLVQKIPPHLEYIDPTMVWDGAVLPVALQSQTTEELARVIERTKTHYQAWVDRAVAAGWPTDRASFDAVEGGFTRAAIAEILAYQARERGATLIVVGRTHHGALHDALIRSTGERLVHYAKGLTVWIVGCAAPPASPAAKKSE